MSLYSDFMELYKKQKKEEALKATQKNTKTTSSKTTNKNTSGKASNNASLLEEFLTLQAESDVIAPVSPDIRSRLTVGDIAPTKKKEEDKWYKGWFQKGAFEDGYDFGDITRTILGTTADIGQDLLQGGLGIVEGGIDFLAANAGNIAKGQYYQNGGGYNIKQDKLFEEMIDSSKPLLEDFAKKNIIDEEKISRVIVSGDYEKQSVFADKTDQVVQSGGQLLATAALQGVGVPWWLTTGATAWGGEYENALNQGATAEEANLSGAISAGAEILTEKLSGGIKFGGKAADDFLTDQIARGISNKFMRNVAKFFPDALVEGMEEMLSQDISSFGQWLTYRDEEELNELLFSEEAMDEKIQAFLGGVLMGGVSNVGNAIKANSQGVDAVSGRTNNEEAVVRKVYEDLVAEKGDNVTGKDKRKIYDQVVRELENGGISTDVIESLLDEEGYKAYEAEKDNFFKNTKKSYNEALESEEAELKQLQEELDKLADAPNTVGNSKRYDSIVSRMTELKENPQSNNLRANLDAEVKRINEMHNQVRTKVHDMVKGTKLEESYNELIRSQQKYEVDLEKYTDPNARKTIENILKSGKGDNTNHFHEYADWLAQISADKGMSFSLTDNEALKGTEHDFSAEGLTTNGYVSADGIVLNMDSPKALNSTVGHEITHVLEQSELYQTLQDTVFKYEIAKNGQEAFDKRLQATIQRYKGKDADAKAELTADLIGDYLFTDYDFVHNLSTENRNVFQKIYDEIKYLCKVVTAGSKEARELEKVKKAFEDAFRANVKGKAETQHSLSDSAGKELTKEQQDYFKDSKMRDENGNLKVMYHGSQDAGFHVFNSDMSDDGTSFFFVDRNDVAASYSGTSETYEAKTIRTAEDMNNFLAEIGYDQYEAVEKNGKFELLENGDHVAWSDTAQGVYEEFCWYEGVGEGDANYKVYLNLTNPLEVDAKGRPWNKIDAEFSQEVYDKFQSLTAEEKAALIDLAEWEDFRLFNSEIQEAVGNELASAYAKLGEDANIYDIFSVAADNFSEESLRENSRKYLKTRDYAQRAKEQGYDGVIFKNIVDNGGYSNGSEGASTVAIAFDSNQIKSVANEKPTADKDIRYSLSGKEKPKQYGDWNVYGSDFGYKGDFAPNIPTPNRNVLPGERMSVGEMFPDEPDVSQAEYDNLTEVKDALEAGMMEMSETGDFHDLETINEKWVEAKTRLAELEAELSERFDSLSDADAPPEMDAPYYESNPTTLTKKATADIVRDVRASLDVRNNEVSNLKNIIEQYRSGEIQTREDLVNALQDNFGTYKETQTDERLAEVKQAIRTRRINVSDTIKHGIADYAHLMRSMRGKMLFAKDGLGVDEVYKELQEYFPDYFNEDEQLSPEDQFRQIVDIANTPHTEEVKRDKDIENIEEAADLIINGIGDFKRNQDLALSNKESKNAFESLVRQGDRYAPMDDIGPVVKKTQLTGENSIPNSTGKAPVKTATKPAARTQNPKVAEVLTKASKKPKEGGIWSKMVSAVVDKGAVFEKVSLDSGNMEVQSKWNYALPTNTEAIAQYFMENGENGVKSLKSVMKEVNKSKKTDAFQNYLYHVHNIDRMTLEDRFGVPNKAVYGDTITADISRKKAAQLAKQNPEFKRWAKDIYNINKQLRTKLVEGGLITQEVANLWEQMYPHYVPITRVDANGLNVNVPLDTNKTGVNNPVKRATGGNSNIEPLFNTMAQRIEQTYRAIARNSFGIELKNTLGTALESQSVAGVDEIIDTIEAQEDSLLKAGTLKSSPTFTVFENGERVEFEITEDMYDALKPANKILASRNSVIKSVGDFRRNLLTVWDPVFALYRNPIKDIQGVAVNSQHPVRTYLNIPNAMWQLAFGGEMADEYHKNGGKSNTYFDSRKNKFNDGWFNKVAGLPVKPIEFAGEFIEEIPRLAEYIASRKDNRSVERSMLDAARVTTNFAAGGDFTKFLNSHGCTFLNASVQGAAQHVRNFREAIKRDGLMGLTKTLAKYVVAGVPGMLLNGLLWDDDEEYEELNDYVKQNYYVIAKTDEGKFIRIPKGRTAAVMHEAMEQMQNLVTGDDEADFATFFELFWDNIAPNNPLKNNIISPVIQAYNNNAWYEGDIVPSRLQDLPAEEQFDESTDSISKWLGEKIGWSPMKINYLLDQYSGGLGDTFLPMLTPEAESGDDTLKGNLLAPWKKEITTDKVLNNKNPGNFYDLKDELEIVSNSKNATDEDKMKSMYMDAVSWEMGDLYAQKREIQSSDLSDSEKYEQVRELQEQINEIAKNATSGYNNVSINGLYSEVGDKRFNLDAESGTWYEIKPKKADGTANWYYQKEQEVTKGLGISYGEYWNNREEYNYAYDNPEKYTVTKVTGGYEAFSKFNSDLWDIKADKDENGKSINGSRKEKVLDYINEMDADYGEKIILFKSEYPADDTYNDDIFEYVNGRDDITYEEKVTIFKYLGFEVDSEGYVTW